MQIALKNARWEDDTSFFSPFNLQGLSFFKFVFFIRVPQTRPARGGNKYLLDFILFVFVFARLSDSEGLRTCICAKKINATRVGGKNTILLIEGCNDSPFLRVAKFAKRNALFLVFGNIK